MSISVVENKKYDINFNYLFEINQFFHGKNFRSYKLFGSKLIKNCNEEGALFHMWAPNAVEVRVIGNFNNWNGTKHVMKKIKDTGIWQLFIPYIKEGDIYKYEIHTVQGKILKKSDPYALYSEVRPNTASVIVDSRAYEWNDEKWMEKRKQKNLYESPINIYELHLGSWRRKENGEFYSYKEIASDLVEYILDMGYTHVEILPISEHPLDDSWGYQCTGYYSVTSRFGNFEDFKYLVDRLHRNNIGVILDWVPGHFCKDEYGLYKFDGTHLYEYEDERKRENYGWGTANFDFTKPEVRSFLISNALFWFEVYHIDGIRIDAVANMIYLNYCKEHLNLRNKKGGIENLEAVDFIKELNQVIFKNIDNPLMIAEESTAWPLVTYPTYMNGLGMNYKWNMGWMNDMLTYMKTPPEERRHKHKLITFSLMYAFSENFVLPLSHDEVVHGKKSLLDKMPGKYEEKFSNLRLFYGYMMGHPGKKLIFMGGEFGQFIEWNFNSELDWNLMKYPIHDALKNYVRDLNELYIKEKSLWQLDHDSKGFMWIDHSNSKQSIISFIRYSKEEKDFVIIICNFSNVTYENFKVGIPRLTLYKEIFNSDRDIYGGSNFVNKDIIKPSIEKCNNQHFSINIKVPALSTMIIKPVWYK